jgi:hypothetical protein
MVVNAVKAKTGCAGSGKEEIRKTGYRMIYRKTERNAERKAEWTKEVIANRSRRKRR